jgi:hypothetical protein
MHERNLEGQPPQTAVLLPPPLEGQAAALRTESLSASETPSAIVAVDDRLTADHALRRIEAGELLWYIGDYPNGRQLLSALRRRLAPRPSRPPRDPLRDPLPDRLPDPLAIFRAERQQRAYEHRTLSRLVVALSREGTVYGKRVPEVAGAVDAALGEREGWALVPLQELLGMIGAAPEDLELQDREKRSRGCPRGGRPRPAGSQGTDLGRRLGLNPNRFYLSEPLPAWPLRPWVCASLLGATHPPLPGRRSPQKVGCSNPQSRPELRQGPESEVLSPALDLGPVVDRNANVLCEFLLSPPCSKAQLGDLQPHGRYQSGWVLSHRRGGSTALVVPAINL